MLTIKSPTRKKADRQVAELIEVSSPEERRRIEIGRREGRRLRAELEEIEKRG